VQVVQEALDIMDPLQLLEVPAVHLPSAAFICLAEEVADLVTITLTLTPGNKGKMVAMQAEIVHFGVEIEDRGKHLVLAGIQVVVLDITEMEVIQQVAAQEQQDTVTVAVELGLAAQGG
jgi:predicted RNA-binding protein with EMAP domain